MNQENEAEKAKWKIENCLFYKKNYCSKIRHSIQSGHAVIAHCLPCKWWQAKGETR